MLWPFIIAALGLLVGTLMGVAMLLRPRGSHLSIGLGSVPEKSGGVGESRAFGGLLFGMHGVALAFVIPLLVSQATLANGPSSDGPVGISATVHVAPTYAAAEWGVLALAPAVVFILLLFVGWLCALLARIASVLIDREGVPLNLRLIGVDLFMTLTLAAPLFVYTF